MRTASIPSPLLLRAIHQAEDLTASAKHAACYLRQSHNDFELCAVESGMSMAGYLLRGCGWGMEKGYIGSFWFETPNDFTTAQPSEELFKLLLSDLARAGRKIRKALELLPAGDEGAHVRHELKMAWVCILGCQLPLRQAQKSILSDMKVAARLLPHAQTPTTRRNP